MNSEYTHLTPDELDKLARLYLDCRLTRLEERELELLLATDSTHRSPAIDEARTLMGLCTAMAALPAQPERRRRRFNFGAVAASLAVLAAASTALLLPDGGTGSTDMVVTVYVDGARVGDPETAHRIADEAMRHSMLALNRAQNETIEAQKSNNPIILTKL